MRILLLGFNRKMCLHFFNAKQNMIACGLENLFKFLRQIKLRSELWEIVCNNFNKNLIKNSIRAC